MSSMAETVESERKPEQLLLRAFARNLASIIVLGVLLSGWAIAYTDAFPTVASLLGLGGVFSWIAFVSELISKDRKEEIQAAVDGFLVRPYAPGMIVLIAGGAFFLWTAGRTSIEVDTTTDGLERVAKISEVGVEPGNDDAHYVSSHTSKNLLLPCNWFGSSPYRVKVSGLPSLVVDGRWLRKRRLVSPGAFLSAPVLLFRPAAQLSANAARGGAGYRLHVIVNGASRAEADYKGESVWAGAEADVAIPVAVKERWRLELLGSRADVSGAEIALTRLCRTIAPLQGSTLAERDLVEVLIEEPDPPKGRRVVASGSGRLTRSGRAEDFPLEVAIDSTP
jgi:hypothetical protein